MNTLPELLTALRAVKEEINDIVTSSQYDKFDDLSGLNINYKDISLEGLKIRIRK